MRLRDGKVFHIDMVDACVDCDTKDSCKFAEKVAEIAGKGVKILVLQFCETAMYKRLRGII